MRWQNPLHQNSPRAACAAPRRKPGWLDWQEPMHQNGRQVWLAPEQRRQPPWRRHGGQNPWHQFRRPPARVVRARRRLAAVRSRGQYLMQQIGPGEARTPPPFRPDGPRSQKPMHQITPRRRVPAAGLCRPVSRRAAGCGGRSSCSRSRRRETTETGPLQDARREASQGCWVEAGRTPPPNPLPQGEGEIFGALTPSTPTLIRCTAQALKGSGSFAAH